MEYQSLYTVSSLSDDGMARKGERAGTVWILSDLVAVA